MEALGIDGRLLIAQIVNFLIFFLIFRKFIALPLAKYLKKQQDDEVKRSALTHELEQARSALDDDRKRMLSDIRSEQKKILTEAKKFADEAKQELLAQSRLQAQEIIQEGKAAVEQERKDAERELSKYVKDAASIAIQRGLASYLTEDTRRQITSQVIKNIQ